MRQQAVSNRILAGAVTFLGLGLVWMAIVNNIPSQQELSAKEPSLSPAQGMAAPAAPEPVLDLSIPGMPSTPMPTDQPRVAAVIESLPVTEATDLHATQVARLRCEAAVEQLCPETSDGPARRQCLEKRAQQLPVSCRQQIRERLVRWREERSRLTLACQVDIRRFCSDARSGGEHQLQCLQKHAQELSDGCYGMLPKGALYFKQ